MKQLEVKKSYHIWKKMRVVLTDDTATIVEMIKNRDARVEIFREKKYVHLLKKYNTRKKVQKKALRMEADHDIHHHSLSYKGEDLKRLADLVNKKYKGKVKQLKWFTDGNKNSVSCPSSCHTLKKLTEMKVEKYTEKLSLPIQEEYRIFLLNESNKSRQNEAMVFTKKLNAIRAKHGHTVIDLSRFYDALGNYRPTKIGEPKLRKILMAAATRPIINFDDAVDVTIKETREVNMSEVCGVTQVNRLDGDVHFRFLTKSNASQKYNKYEKLPDAKKDELYYESCLLRLGDET